VLKGLDAADAGDGPGLEVSDGASGIEPGTLLALVSYCYASEVYGSDEVERLISLRPELSQFCPENPPDARCIRRFRRENREAIERCVAAALRHLAEQRVREGWLTRIHPAQFTIEAKRRLITAMFVDSMELDGE
jgi:hypothetical protein